MQGIYHWICSMVIWAPKTRYRTKMGPYEFSWCFWICGSKLACKSSFTGCFLAIKPSSGEALDIQSWTLHRNHLLIVPINQLTENEIPSTLNMVYRVYRCSTSGLRNRWRSYGSQGWRSIARCCDDLWSHASGLQSDGEKYVYIYIYDSRYIHFKICLIYINFYTYTYTLRAHHQECIFHMRMRPQKRALVAAPFEHKPTDSQTNSPLPNCEETNCNGLCLGRHVARKQARGVEPIKTPCGQTPRRPRYPKLLLLKPACK